MTRAPDTALELSLLGVPSVRIGTEPVRLSLTRAYALLSYLALEGRAVRREQLASLLWPDAEAAVGRARLRRLIYQTEELCARDLFQGHDGSISLSSESIRCDAVAFRRVARTVIAGGVPAEPQSEVEALALAACSPLMDGLQCDSGPFDDWLSAQRVEHEQLLCRLLVRLAEQQRARQRFDAAIDTVERLLRVDPFSEPAHVLRMTLAADARDAAGVDAAFMRCADALRAEFGTKPAAATERAYSECLSRAASSQGAGSRPGDELHAPFEVRFAFGRHGPVAYATLGRGSEALVVMPGFVSHMEIGWEHPGIRSVLSQLARHFKVVLFDRRGVGLSERMGAVSTIDSAVDDVLTILDAASIAKAWLFGSSEGGPAAIRLAARHPSRVTGLLLFGAMARGSRAVDYPWALHREGFDAWMQNLVANWGGPADIETFAPTLQHDPSTRAWWSRMLRHAASPASIRAVLAGLRDADVRDSLPAIRCPTLVMHRRGDRAVRFEAGEHLASSISGAEFVAMEGACHWWWVEHPDDVAKHMLRFTGRGDAHAAPALDSARDNHYQ
jgi:pimeloyl-ACP methyl ester carboxylesterase/DNA-binding SARP family transcriptional activator